MLDLADQCNGRGTVRNDLLLDTAIAAEESIEEQLQPLTLQTKNKIGYTQD